MEKLKVIALTGHLTEADKENVLYYLQSPRLANRKDIYMLFKTILKHDGQGSQALLWKEVYPKQKPNAQKFAKLCFETLQEIEACLSTAHFMREPNLQQQQLIRYYLEYELKDFAETKIDKAIKTMAGTKKYGSDNYLHQYQLEHLRFLYLQKKENVQTSLNIAASSAGLDKFYFLQKLKYICNTINYRAILGKTETVEFTNEVIGMVEDSSLIDDKLISIYHALYYVLSAPENEDNFHNAKTLLSANLDQLENSEFADIVQYLINYCIKKINQSVDAYLEELFIIYCLYLKKIPEKVFSPIRFKNIFLLALKMKKYEWAEKFIEGYGPKLPKDQRETTIAYNKARLFYELKQYDKVLSTLLHLHHEEVQFNLISRVLVVKTFYEKNEIQFLENYLMSFKAYILRNKEMNTQNKNIHLNFLKMMKKLIRLEYGSKLQISAFRQKTEAFPNLPDKPWFLEKIDAL